MDFSYPTDVPTDLPTTPIRGTSATSPSNINYVRSPAAQHTQLATDSDFINSWLASPTTQSVPSQQSSTTSQHSDTLLSPFNLSINGIELPENDKEKSDDQPASQQQEIDLLKGRLAQAIGYIKKIKAENAKLKSEHKLGDEQVEIARLRAEKEQQISTNETMLHTITQLKMNNQKLQERVDTVELENSNIQFELITAQKRITALQDSLDNSTQSNATIDTITRELQQTLQEKNKLEKKCLALQTRYDDGYADFENEIEMLRHAHQREIDEIELRRQEQLETERLHVVDQVNNQNVLKRQHIEEMAQKDEEIETLTVSTEQLSHAIVQLQQSLATQDERFHSLMIEKESVEQQLSSQDELLQAKCEALRQDHELVLNEQRTHLNSILTQCAHHLLQLYRVYNDTLVLCHSSRSSKQFGPIATLPHDIFPVFSQLYQQHPIPLFDSSLPLIQIQDLVSGDLYSMLHVVTPVSSTPLHLSSTAASSFASPTLPTIVSSQSQNALNENETSPNFTGENPPNDSNDQHAVQSPLETLSVTSNISTASMTSQTKGGTGSSSAIATNTQQFASPTAQLHLQAGHHRQMDRLRTHYQKKFLSFRQYITKLHIVIARFQHYTNFLTAQLEQALVSKRRHNIDLDYLKTIMLRFLQFHHLALYNECNALSPVIMTLLHFSPQEKALVKNQPIKPIKNATASSGRRKQQAPSSETSSIDQSASAGWWGGLWGGSSAAGPSTAAGAKNPAVVSVHATALAATTKKGAASYSQVSHHDFSTGLDPMSALQTQTTSLKAIALKQERNNSNPNNNVNQAQSRRNGDSLGLPPTSRTEGDHNTTNNSNTQIHSSPHVSARSTSLPESKSSPYDIVPDADNDQMQHPSNNSEELIVTDPMNELDDAMYIVNSSFMDSHGILTSIAGLSQPDFVHFTPQNLQELQEDDFVL